MLEIRHGHVQHILQPPGRIKVIHHLVILLDKRLVDGQGLLRVGLYHLKVMFQQIDHALVDGLGEDEEVLDDHPARHHAAWVFQVVVEELHPTNQSTRSAGVPMGWHQEDSKTHPTLDQCAYDLLHLPDFPQETLIHRQATQLPGFPYKVPDADTISHLLPTGPFKLNTKSVRGTTTHR